MTKKSGTTIDLKAWALHAAKTVHPAFVANEWDWWVHGTDPVDGEYEIPSVERIAATLEDIARRIAAGEAGSGTSTGRLTVYRHEDEVEGVVFSACLELDDTTDVAELLAAPIGSGDQS